MEQATGARRAAVAMSGGVDSSVAALLLAQAGWACTGVTLRLYAGADAAPDGARTCCSLEDVEDARAVADLVEQRFPKMQGKVEIFSIGTTIGSHTGPGTVALFFWGKERGL